MVVLGLLAIGISGGALPLGGCTKKKPQPPKNDGASTKRARDDGEARPAARARPRPRPIAPLTKRSGVRVLVLEGGPEKRGRVQGTLLKKEIQTVVKKYVQWFLYRYMGGKEIVRVVASSAEASLANGTKAEMKALAKAAGVSYEDILVLNTHVDSMSSACSTVAVTSKATVEKKTLLARNLDWPAPPDMNHLAVLTVVRDPEKANYANFTFPGFLGVLTAMNGSGLTVSMNVSAAKDAARLCVPTPLLLRNALMSSSTVDEFFKKLEGAKRCSGFIITAADKKGGVEVLEYSASHSARRAPDHEVLSSTNHFRTKAMKRQQIGGTRGSKKRLSTLQNNCTYMKGTPLSAKDLKAALTTQPVFNKKTLMSVVACPKEGWLELWQRGEPKGRFARLEISKLLSGEIPVSEALPLGSDTLKDLD